MQNTNSFQIQPTEDGSFTFFSTEFGETFHSSSGARQEARLKFVQPLDLMEKARQPSVRLLDICYGLGYNTGAALEAIWAVNPQCYVEAIALELDPAVPKAAIAHHLTDIWHDSTIEIWQKLATNHQIQTNQLRATLSIGDARKTIQQVCQNFQADAIFLDPFSPPVCPQLWTVEFLGLVAKCLKPDGRIATYSCSAAVRSALLTARLHIGSTTPVGRRSPGTVASYIPINLHPLSPQEQEHLQTRAAVPYRDPNLADSAKVILDRRKIEQESSVLEPTAHWKKRWLMART